MSTVNGFYCRNCTDEVLARRGIDPARGSEAQQRLQSSREREREVVLGDNRPQPGQALGGALDLFA